MLASLQALPGAASVARAPGAAQVEQASSPVTAKKEYNTALLAALAALVALTLFLQCLAPASPLAAAVPPGSESPEGYNTAPLAAGMSAAPPRSALHTAPLMAECIWVAAVVARAGYTQALGAWQAGAAYRWEEERPGAAEAAASAAPSGTLTYRTSDRKTLLASAPPDN